LTARNPGTTELEIGGFAGEFARNKESGEEPVFSSPLGVMPSAGK
jgi:hypothetical protein